MADLSLNDKLNYEYDRQYTLFRNGRHLKYSFVPLQINPGSLAAPTSTKFHWRG